MRRVALFVTCAADLAMPGVVQATRRLIEATGATVQVPQGQSCCGQVALNSGHKGPGLTLARHWVETFRPYDLVVAPSGSCVATVHHSFPRLDESPEWQAEVGDLAGRTMELTQFLVAHGQDLRFRLDATVAWHHSCHMLRMLGETTSALTVLGRVEGLTVREFDEERTCCGFGGTFSTTFPELSAAMADRKLDSAAASGVDHLVSADPGCLLHLDGRHERQGRPEGRPMHVAELLDRSLIRNTEGVTA